MRIGLVKEPATPGELARYFATVAGLVAVKHACSQTVSIRLTAWARPALYGLQQLWAHPGGCLGAAAAKGTEEKSGRFQTERRRRGRRQDENAITMMKHMYGEREREKQIGKEA